MGRKRYYYDSKGRARGFSSDEGPGSRNAKALMIALLLVALMSMCRGGSEQGAKEQSDAADALKSLPEGVFSPTQRRMIAKVAELQIKCEAIHDPGYRQACDARRAAMQRLNAAGVCYGRKEAYHTIDYHLCDEGSLREE